jgi:hypothetical protein
MPKKFYEIGLWINLLKTPIMADILKSSDEK